MNENENLAAPEAAENVEQITTEEPPAVKTYSQEEVDAIVGKAKARTRAKIEKDYQRKYGELETVVLTGMGKKSVEEATESLKDFYKQKGVQMPSAAQYSDRDIEVLARAEAEDIISSGYDEVVEEVDRLTELGVANMTAKEKAVFKTLAEHRSQTEKSRELQSLGVTEDVYNSAEFKAFAGKFSATTPIREIYDIYAKTQPKKEIKTMGSMRNTSPGDDSGVKDFYTYEESLQFTKKDFDKNPALFKAVKASMAKW